MERAEQLWKILRGCPPTELQVGMQAVDKGLYHFFSLYPLVFMKLLRLQKKGCCLLKPAEAGK